MNKTTEQDSNYNYLEKMDTLSLLKGINQEDKGVSLAVERIIPKIESLVDAIHAKMAQGGRLFYIGAGTSGRLGIVDASECPPTFGTSSDKVIGLIAGGDHALRNSIEKAEDDSKQAWKDLKKFQINNKDIVIGIAASGTTPYVVGGLKDAQKNGITTGCIVCNINSPLANFSDFPIEVVVGPEYLTGSSRMKAGTAQKLILNSITTATMIQLGHVRGNKMVDMQLTNNKLQDRAEKIVYDATGAEINLIKKYLKIHGNARKAIDAINKN